MYQTYETKTGRLSFLLVCAAAQMLRERHKLVRFGGYMRDSGEVVPVLPDLDKDPEGTWSSVDELRNALRSIAPGAVAFGIVTNSVATDDAGVQRTMIEVFLEHRSGFCGRAGAEYTWADGKLTMGEPYAHESGPLFFRALQ